MECLPAGRPTEPLRLASVLSRSEIGIAPGTLALSFCGESGSVGHDSHSFTIFAVSGRHLPRTRRTSPQCGQHSTS